MAPDRDYCYMECGEEELDVCQKTFYQSKQNDLNELIQLVVNAHSGVDIDLSEDVGALANHHSKSSSASTGLEELLNQPATSTPRHRPLVVLDPATLNQLATSNGYRVPGSSASRDTPVSASGHCLPAVAPSFKVVAGRAVRIPPTVPASTGMITLSALLNDSAQSSLPPRQGPRMRFPAPSPPQAVHIPPTSSPRVHVMSPQMRVRAKGVSVPTADCQIRTLLPTPIYTYPQVGVMTPSSNTNGIAPPSGPRAHLSAPPKFVETLNSNDASVKSTVSILSEMQKKFGVSHENCDDNSNLNHTSSLPPAELPLLPETRPETASDSRPRPRPGPASRTMRLPSVSSLLESHASSDMVDLTQDDQPQSTAKKAPTKEKTFPSLIVTARASLRIFSTARVNNERLLMDNLIRKVMQMPPSVFTEHLLQQRLLKSEQSCKEHHKPLKLGTYSDPKRFPVSGGYVWIADCCNSGFCSVYTGSIFDKTLQPPTNIIKLMYHWACNTAVHNVLNWVKVDSYVMKTYNTFFRAVCTAVVHQKFDLLGGLLKKIQVGVISIGTYPDGTSKEVKVDIMAVMDPDIPSIRLKVLENFLSDSNKVYESKFRKILEVLKDWVHPESTIITDFAVDLSLCREYGFSNLVVSGGRHGAINNNAIMDYMRAKIPVMFQNTLGLLSYTIIQQFLDELVWRETWGPFPSRAYDSLVEHMAELTVLPGPDLITKLKKIASEPTKDWKYSVWKDESVPENVGLSKVGESVPEAKNKVPPEEKIQNRVSTIEEIKSRPSSTEEMNRERPSDSTEKFMNSLDPAVAVPINMVSQQKDNDRKIFLEPFYYGVVDGDPKRQKRFGSFLAECVFCKRDFLSASSFTNHLIHHALNNNSTLSNVSVEQLLNVCTLCCKPVRGDVDRHKKQKHPYPPSSKHTHMCKICRIDLKEADKIVKHMVLVHQELDMPYKCDLCRFQTSIYENAVTHFKEFHDKDYCVRCPYCLKTVRFCTKSGVEILKNQYYFVQHVQKHSVNKLNRKCEKCVLSFTNMATLKQHQEKVHKRSGRVLKNVRRLKLDTAKMLMMSLPVQAPLPPVTLHESSFHTLKGKALSSSVVVPEYYAVCSCLECDGPMTQNHFSVKMTCTRCSFQSCCANSIREHSARRHHVMDNPSEQYLRSQIIGGSAILDKPIYCTYCSYSSSNGNKMAAHLSACGDEGASATPDKRQLTDAFLSPCKAQKIL